MLGDIGAECIVRGPTESALREEKIPMAHMRLTAVFQQVPEGYIAFVEELPGANTQGATIEEARANLAEAIEMVLDANRALAQQELAGVSVIREPIEINV